MSLFCTERACMALGLENIEFVYCCRKGYAKNKFIENSKIFYIDKNSESFIRDIKSLLLPEQKEIILIDCEYGFDLASKVFWGLKAAGFVNLKILIGSPNEIPMSEGQIEEVAKAEFQFLPFNNSVVLTKSDLENKTSFYQQLVHVNSLDLEIDEDFLLYSKDEIFELLVKIGIKFSKIRSSILFGKKSCFAGVLIALATGKTVSVVIDEIEAKSNVEKKPETEETSAYSVAHEDNFKPAASKPRAKTERDSAVCANCLVF